MGSSCGTSCAGKRRCAKLPTRGSRSPQSRLRPSGCASAPWSHRCHDADRKVARETATLDWLSGGRLTLGVGIGGDSFAHEFSKTGEQLSERARGQMLDEALEILTTAWSGEPVHHHGDHYTVDDIQFLPRPVQRPGVPVWIAGFPGNVKPMRRAARYDGFFPANLEHPDQLAEIVAIVAELRVDATAPYDIVVGLPVGVDPAPYVEAGATWWLPEFSPEALSLDGVRGLLRQGPFAP